MKRPMKFAVSALAAAILALSAMDAAAEPVLIRDARVVTNTSAGIIENSDVLFNNGRVVAVGEDLRAPANARVIDAAGQWVTPGAFEPMSMLGLFEIAGSGAPNDARISGDIASAGVDASRAFNPAGVAMPMVRRNGITRAATAPFYTSGVFDGQGALVSMSGAPDSLFKPQAFMLVELGERGADHAGGSRAVLWPVFEAALNDALQYPARYRSGQGGVVLNELDAAALKPFAQGRGLFVAQMERASDIRELIAFKRAHPSLKFAIYGGAEAWQVAGELAAARIPVILNPFSDLPASFETLGARLDNAAILSAAGVTIALAPGPGGMDPQEPLTLLQLAGNAVAHGMPWEDAFRAVTKAPADIYGVGDTYGALARGYVADVVIWDGDPLEVTSAPTAVFIAGEEQSLVTRQTRLRDRYSPVGR